VAVLEPESADHVVDRRPVGVVLELAADDVAFHQETSWRIVTERKLVEVALQLE
jgi:hypothetical protein